MSARSAAAALALLLAGGAAPAAQAEDPRCVLHWQVQPDYASSPRALDVELRFPAGDRTETYLRLTPSWAGVDDAHRALQGWRGLDEGVQVAAADLPNRWRVQHPPGGTVRVAWRAHAALADPHDGQPQLQQQLYRTQIGADWFQFFGHGVLPSVEPWGDGASARLCVTVAQPGQPDAPAFGSHLAGRGPKVHAAFTGSPALLRDAFYGGGRGWRLNERALPSGTVHTAVRHTFAVDDETFADQASALIDSHRRFWGETAALPQWLVLTPNFAPGNAGGTLVHQAAVLHAEPQFSPAAGTFEFLVGHENLHQWIPNRFGAHLQGEPGDTSATRDVWNYWFSEGFTNHYTHRLLLASGLWTLPRYAAQLTDVLRAYWRSPHRNAPVDAIAPVFFSDRDAGRQMYARGELLALRWDGALRDRGHAGLDAVLKGLLLPPAQATQEQRLATERVLEGLQAELGALPRRDVAAHAHAGHTLPLAPTLPGPCFSLGWDDVPRWTLGFDAASFGARRAQGVVPGGPAHRAGLREGMTLLGWSVYGNDTAREVELAVENTAAAPPGRQTLKYLPLDGRSERLPTVTARADAAQSVACQGWIHR